MAEIEDVARPPGRPPQDVARLALDDLPGGEQRRRLEIALDGPIGDDGPALVEREPPVEADHVAARARDLGQQVGRARPEVDRGNVDRCEHAALQGATRSR